MNSAIERLLSLKVADVARHEVVAVSSHAPMTSAAHALLVHQISGAPVIDEQGRCVGILSATDFVRRAQSQSASGGEVAPGGDVPHDSVAQYMTPAVQTVTGESSLLDAARIMCAAHVHRLVVVDEHGQPDGLITSLDVAAAFVQAIEE